MLTFTQLFPMGSRPAKQRVERCAALLPNKMQCPKGSSWSVSDDSTTPPTVTQYCHGHAAILEQQQKDDLARVNQPAPETVAVTTGSAPDPEKTQTELNAKTTESKPESVNNDKPNATDTTSTEPKQPISPK